MLDLMKEFTALGFAREEDEEKNAFYVMDFPADRYVTVTDDTGSLPEKAKQNLVLACYDAEGRYIWGSEVTTFMELQTLCTGMEPGSEELLQRMQNASKTLKDTDWPTPSHP